MKSDVFISRYVAQSGQAWTTSRLSPKTRANCRVTWLPQLTHRGAVVCWPDVIGVQFADGSVDIIIS